MYEMDYYSVLDFAASAEWITPDIGFIRGGQDWAWGEPYQFTCLIVVENEIGTVKGYLGVYNRTIRECIKLLCRQSGIKKIVYERMNQKTRREKEILLT